MTRDEIIALAHRLDVLDEQHYGTLWVDKLVRFAAEIERKARADTREACAAKMDLIAQECRAESSDYWQFVWAAAAIRALGDEPCKVKYGYSYQGPYQAIDTWLRSRLIKIT